ncbi:amidohydrolase [Rhizobium sp. VS19-DR104.2]|uniref:M20 aminoacylase family protein n=1 Tax=unclassified Rhizobium TaxID=2613769 RepID=UPI001C5A7E47|nr:MULTISPECIES: M20 aminoacylase family protein [unclassified Rhizobium]MBZ5763412.1 amidohydrolase [Rhizobium sp. VS19-DR96]MBZ5769307.1 amidohydrolase [Rhizobium sp. VS19-DR129.2]MBZ5776884.1 amidohydrolase [Rhizobium sp. VS19-DRK62.2]MBZ5787995.1 amidohydrolase [Rhizobium sp. VS19-DR121]MBZ5805456.1 amidohydrolase [Rhizobium sp. VS19-DR181]
MPAMESIAARADELTAIRRDLHQHPEIGFEEVRTSGIVAEQLESYGIEVHRGIGKTGVVGIVRGLKGEGRTIGLRADMDALPMEERTNLAYASRNAGRFHGCGHDGHTTMLLGAARYLAETRAFAGTAVLIFQPGEEGCGGARAMLADGLFRRFPCAEIYALHNSPQDDPYRIGIKPGPAMAGADFFDIRVRGRGSHGAHPETSRDPIIVATALVQALQSIVSRNVSPLKQAVLSVTQVHSGSAYNVVPEDAVISGTVRFLDRDVNDLMRKRIREISTGIALSFGVEIDVDIRNVFDVLMNTEDLVEGFMAAARDIVGDDQVYLKTAPVMGSEDFADMLHVCPGVYCTIGHAGTVPVHNPAFILDDGILPVGASLLARIVERRLRSAAT